LPLSFNDLLQFSRNFFHNFKGLWVWILTQFYRIFPLNSGPILGQSTERSFTISFSCFFLGFFIMLCKLTFRALAKNVSQNQCISLSVVDQSSLFWLLSVFTPRLKVRVRPENQCQNNVSNNCLDLLLFHTIFTFLSLLF
jgi:hypothetical protein